LNEAVSRAIAGILDLPVEHATVEFLQVAIILAVDFEPRNGWLRYESDS
jgi:hypothetical protein